MDGIIIVNKPKGCTSHDVVNKVKRILNEKVGHTGTLDPNATGVLPLLVGKGTKLSSYLIKHDKEYITNIKLGEKTDTADCEGKVIQKEMVDEKVLKKENINNVLNSLIGKQKQVPPMYSAIKINGKKLYEYARKNEKINVEARQIEIYNLELLNIIEEKKELVIKVECSKGTYIRSLCEEIAKRLGTIGYMKELQRTKVGNFYIENSITIEELEQNIHDIKFFEKNFITIENFFENISNIDLIEENNSSKSKYIILDEKKLHLFLNGVKLNFKEKEGLYRIYTSSNKFIGIGIVKNGILKREIIVEK